MGLMVRTAEEGKASAGFSAVLQPSAALPSHYGVRTPLVSPNHPNENHQEITVCHRTLLPILGQLLSDMEMIAHDRSKTKIWQGACSKRLQVCSTYNDDFNSNQACQHLLLNVQSSACTVRAEIEPLGPLG